MGNKREISARQESRLQQRSDSDHPRRPATPSPGSEHVADPPCRPTDQPSSCFAQCVFSHIFPKCIRIPSATSASQAVSVLVQPCSASKSTSREVFRNHPLRWTPFQNRTIDMIRQRLMATADGLMKRTQRVPRINVSGMLKLFPEVGERHGRVPQAGRTEEQADGVVPVDLSLSAGRPCRSAGKSAG